MNLVAIVIVVVTMAATTLTSEIDVNACTDETLNCGVNGYCNDKGFCECSYGYHGDGVVCQDIDECTKNTHYCSPEAVCTNTVGDFNCTCKDGYAGDGVTCDELRACSSVSGTCQAQGTGCAGGTTLNSGFTCGASEECCVDVNECTDNTNYCSHEAACTNTVGGFTCKCKDGFYGSGNVCQELRACSSVSGTCQAQGTGCTVGTTLNSGITCGASEECCVPNCFKHGYGGMGKAIKKFNKVISAKDCQSHCQQRDGCLAWVWRKNRKRCALKSKGIGEAVKGRKSVAGPKYCPADEGIELRACSSVSGTCQAQGTGCAGGTTLNNGFTCGASEECCVPNCYTGDGRTYAGNIATTKSGKLCLHWSAPGNVEYATNLDDLPDYSLIAAANYCRNFLGHLGSSKPWCFIDGIDPDWEDCDVPQCEG